MHFILDGGFWNVGSSDLQGINFNISYVCDVGAFGALNTGVTGTYYDHDYTTLAQGEPPKNEFHALGPCATGQCYEAMEYRMRYRARLGWADASGYSIAGFMDYQSHEFSANSMPQAAYLEENANFADVLPAQLPV